MKIARFAFRSINDGLSRRIYRPHVARTLSTNATPGNGMAESADEFERRIFGGISGSNNNPRSDAFFNKLDRLGKSRDGMIGENSSSVLDGLDESFTTLSDDMDDKLMQSATDFQFDPEEVDQEDYSFRPDVDYQLGMTYTPKELDLTKPGVRKPFKRYEFEVTTEEVLRKADFRNVRFLANFLTQAGIIIKRSQTGISAKAQRKVAREIKTARAFGLMPFTTMGTKSFVFGKTMEALDDDFEYFDRRRGAETYGNDPLGG